MRTSTSSSIARRRVRSGFGGSCVGCQRGWRGGTISAAELCLKKVRRHRSRRHFSELRPNCHFSIVASIVALWLLTRSRAVRVPTSTQAALALRVPTSTRAGLALRERTPARSGSLRRGWGLRMPVGLSLAACRPQRCYDPADQQGERQSEAQLRRDLAG